MKKVYKYSLSLPHTHTHKVIRSNTPNKMKVCYMLKITLHSIKHKGMIIKHSELNKIHYRFNIVCKKIQRKMYFELGIKDIEKLAVTKLGIEKVVSLS